jgi:hypothetical protein
MLNLFKKTTSVLLLTVILAGCSTLKDKVENFYLAKWDANEAAYAADVKYQALDLTLICDTNKFSKEQQVNAIFKLNSAANKFQAYAETLPDDNRPVITVAKNIADSSKEFLLRSRDGMSKLYCEAKATALVNMSHQAQVVIQKKRI